MDEREIKEKLKCSLEIAYIRSAAMIFTVISLAYIGLMILSWGGWVLALVTGALVLVPLWGWYGWRAWKIFRAPGSYRFCSAKLSQPHSSRFFRTFYFTVLLETEDRQQIVVNTHAIFQGHGWLGPLLEDYVNRTVTIGYNRATQTVVVIG